MHGSHGRLNKMVPYAEAMNIPLIIRWPGRIEAGSRIDPLQVPMDHLPTLCGLAGINIPSEADGTDMSRVILGKEKDSREEVLIGSYTSHWDFFQTGTRWPEWRGIKTKQYTCCKWLTGEEELYDDRGNLLRTGLGPVKDKIKSVPSYVLPYSLFIFLKNPLSAWPQTRFDRWGHLPWQH
jgi:arylsulfatase A-like enzyme